MTSVDLSHHFLVQVPDFTGMGGTCYSFKTERSLQPSFVMETNRYIPGPCNLLGILRFTRNAANRGHHHFTRGDHGRLVDGDLDGDSEFKGIRQK